MLNEAPIFLNCFSRGGSNILWNVFLTHPDVCSPIQETIQIFRFDRRSVTWAGARVAFLGRQMSLFNQWHLEKRRPVSTRTRITIDRTLYDWKMKTLDDSEMRYKSEQELYNPEEVRLARLVAKNNNGLVFLTDLWLDMYPDAIFFALVRDPVALYESHKRRRIHNSIDAFAAFYNAIVDQMWTDAEALPNYHLVRFEDLMADLARSVDSLYQLAGLDRTKVARLRFKAKPHRQANGSHSTPFEAGRHYWFDLNDLDQILEPDINSLQAERLTEDERSSLRRLTRENGARLGYSEA